MITCCPVKHSRLHQIVEILVQCPVIGVQSHASWHAGFDDETDPVYIRAHDPIPRVGRIANSSPYLHAGLSTRG
jgi:hypothetical protein